MSMRLPITNTWSFFFHFIPIAWSVPGLLLISNSFVVLLLLSPEELSVQIYRAVYSWNLLTMMSAVEETKAIPIYYWPPTLIP